MRSAGRRAPWFDRLRLANWRNFAEVDVPLQKRFFLAGPNASGKSNFLDAFRFLHDIAAIGGGFQEAVARRGGVASLRCLAARRHPHVAVAVGVSTRGGARWEYEIAFTQDSRRRPVLQREEVRRDGEAVLARPSPDDRRDPARLRQTCLEQINANRDFRELADFFASVRHLHLVPQLVRDPDRYAPTAADTLGSDLLARIARTPERARQARLDRIEAALKTAVPQLQRLEFVRDTVHGTPHLRGRCEHWRGAGAWQTEEAFSDGTLRLIGLLWAVLDEGGPLLLEEPELSLHPEVVRFLPQMFAGMQGRTGRQVLISSHSPDLLRDEGIGLDEVALLEPGAEGTRVSLASSIAAVRELLQGGVPLADALLPYTRPAGAARLSFFGD